MTQNTLLKVLEQLLHKIKANRRREMGNEGSTPTHTRDTEQPPNDLFSNSSVMSPTSAPHIIRYTTHTKFTSFFFFLIHTTSMHNINQLLFSIHIITYFHHQNILFSSSPTPVTDIVSFHTTAHTVISLLELVQRNKTAHQHLQCGIQYINKMEKHDEYSSILEYHNLIWFCLSCFLFLINLLLVSKWFQWGVHLGSTERLLWLTHCCWSMIRSQVSSLDERLGVACRLIPWCQMKCPLFLGTIFHCILY